MAHPPQVCSRGAFAHMRTAYSYIGSLNDGPPRHGQAHPPAVGRLSKSPMCSCKLWYEDVIYRLTAPSFNDPMEVIIESERPCDVDVELHFYDKTVYAFTAELRHNPYVIKDIQFRSHIVGRNVGDVNKFLIRYEDYWYEEYVPFQGTGDLVVKLSGRDRATQMLRDAAMRAKPVVE